MSTDTPGLGWYGAVALAWLVATLYASFLATYG